MINLKIIRSSKQEKSKKSLFVFLFIGILAVFYAEVNSGSSPLWFVNPWGLIIVFWLYFSHLLFYVNVAIRKNRVSLSQLYLLGCLVGLYEGPITKVLYHGYPNGDPASVVFMGFAVLEFIMLVFFWHPIFSFLLPVIVFELLSLDYLQKNAIHSWLEDSVFFTRPRLAKFIFMTIAFIGATFLASNTGFDYGIILFAGLGNFIMLMILKWFNLNNQNLKGIQSLYLSNKWFIIVFIYLILLYTITFSFLETQYIPQLYTLALTGLIYIFILGLFFISPITLKSKSIKVAPLDYNKIIQYSWILWIIFLLIIPITAGPFSIFFLFLYLSLLGFGLLLFFSRFLWIFKRSNSRSVINN